MFTDSETLKMSKISGKYFKRSTSSYKEGFIIELLIIYLFINYLLNFLKIAGDRALIKFHET